MTLSKSLNVKYAIIILMTYPALAVADDRPPLATDRPGFSDGSNLVGKGTLQLESGIFRTYAQGQVTTSVGDSLLRFGISDDIEARVIGLTYGFAAGNSQSILDPSIGFKYRLSNPSQHQAELTFVGQTTVPIGGHPLRANAWNPTMKVAWTAPIGRETLGGNVVYSQVGPRGSQFSQSGISVYMSHPATSRLTLTSELWMVDRVALGSSGGAFGSLAGAYILNPDTQVDLRIGSGFNQSRDGWFVQSGISWRF